MNPYTNKIIYGLGVCTLVFSGCNPHPTYVTPDDLNVIFILADDMGWSDCTLYGTTDLFETPNIQRLADRGLTFTRAYAASPLCSPTRATIMTGQTNARNGITVPTAHLEGVIMHPSVRPSGPAGDKALEVVSVNRLDTNLPTLGKLIKAGGYATAHFGKWHLGRVPYSPLEHGFDVDIPHWYGPGPAGSYVAPWAYPDFKENYPKEHIEDRMAEEASAWMREKVEAGERFYMHYWQFSVHGPWDAKEELIDYYRPKIDTTQAQRSSTYAAMVHTLDDAVGALLDEVDRLGIADNTAIIFLSDNGGNIHVGLREYTSDGLEYITRPTSNAPLRGGKASMFEGGIRIPGIVVWPGLTKPGKRTDAMIQSTDFYPTILNLLEIKIPDDHPVDGVDITPALRGEKWERPPMFTYFPSPPKAVPDWLPPAMAVHEGYWKLIRLFHQGEDMQHDYLLYDLKEDIGETTNLSDKYPEIVSKMDALIEQHIQDTKALVPLPNPDFDINEYKPEKIGVQPRLVIRPSQKFTINNSEQSQ